MSKRQQEMLRAMLAPSLVLALLATIVLVMRFAEDTRPLDKIGAEVGYDFSLQMGFESNASDISVETYLPQSSENQMIINESVVSGNMQLTENIGPDGRHASWIGDGPDTIIYRATISARGIEYDVDPNLSIPKSYPSRLGPHLRETQDVQVNHPEIAEFWETIEPEDTDKILPVLQAIYDFTYDDIEGAAFKGTTDALTALRLRQASCNGKGRLFVALARYNGIPARLIGGVILNNGAKRTSHQWIEVYVQDRWVPFDPTNGHFASLPANYLRLYVGDHVLFTHTSSINFDYRFSIQKRILTPALYQFDNTVEGPLNINAAQLLSFIGLDEDTIGIFLIFPFAALIIAFLRNIVGVKTFGTFMPMLIAAACLHTGLFTGVATFVFVVAFAFLSQVWLAPYNLMKVPRLAAIVTMCTILFLTAVLALGQRITFEFSILALFPVVIISFLSDHIHDLVTKRDWKTAYQAAFGALLTIVLCFLAFSSLTLQSAFAVMPELLLIVLAAQIAIGQWSGMRLMEYVRFRNILKTGPILGMNGRNRQYISKLNHVQLLRLAADKLQTKSIMENASVTVAKTLGKCHAFHELKSFMKVVAEQESFALKPNNGAQGAGIMIVTGRDGENFIGSGGKTITLKQIEHHVRDILAGVYSQEGEEDTAYIEPLLIQDARLSALGNFGLADIRVILHQHEPISAMLRFPTRASKGKSNLHQGAIGIAINLKTGRTYAASIGGKPVEFHPDTGAELLDFQIPEWRRVLTTARRASYALPLGYIGVDICIDETQGPLILEVNGRPGIEIQNVQKQGLFGPNTDWTPSYV